MKEQGELSELKFLYEAYQRGITISKPFGDNAKYDFITDKEKILRVQVKSTTYIRTRGNSTYFQVKLSHSSKTEAVYTKDQIDIFAVYIIPQDSWYFIPIKDCKISKIEIRTNCKIGKSKYDQYKNRWDLF